MPSTSLKTTISELQQQLAIDKSVLDDEVIRQPVLFYTVSEMLTDALAERDGAKEELAYVDAAEELKARRALAKVHGKVTDAMVKHEVQRSKAHTQASDDYLDAKHKADKLLALKDAFQQRSYMLRDLVSLYSANYYESSSMKPTKAQEASQYASQRSRMSTARAARER